MTKPKPGDALQRVAGEVVNACDKRTYNGLTYQCLRVHTTQIGWELPKFAALWKEVTK